MIYHNLCFFISICHDLLKFFALFFLHSDLSSLYGINPKIRLLCDRPFSCATREIDQVAKVNRQQTIELICVFFLLRLRSWCCAGCWMYFGCPSHLLGCDVIMCCVKGGIVFCVKMESKATAITVAKERYRFLSDHPGPHNPYHPDIYN